MSSAIDYRSVLVAAYVVWFLVIVAIDVRTRRAPNRIVLPSIVVAVLASIPLGQAAFIDAVAGGGIAFLALALVVIAGRGRMGAGDAKVGTVAGLAVGLSSAMTMLAYAFIGGAIVAVFVLALGIRKRNDSAPFTPMLFAGVLAALLMR